MDESINGIVWSDDGVAKGTAVIFIHGFPFNRSMWKPQVEALAKTHRVVTFDVRGHGQSDAGDGQYSIEFFVDDLIAGMDRLKIERAVVCGLSMGGYVALRAVERHPERFKALVLCDTKSEADGNEAKTKRAAAVRSVKKDGVRAFADGFVKSVLGENTLKTKPELVESVLAMIRANSALGIAGTLLALAARTDTTAALAKFTLPALILVGEEDKLTPPANSEAMARSLPTATLHVIPGAAHLSNLENPDAFNERLLGFLKTVQ
jgi:3-oxoadipate enol-lactonase